tara:strand:- start:1072 stop:1185 length:114 start_codon:yes stop_codon:yes gene_type:complete
MVYRFRKRIDRDIDIDADIDNGYRYAIVGRINIDTHG